MGRAPYKSAKEGGGCSFECFSRPPMSCLQHLMLSKQIVITYRSHQWLWIQVRWHATLWMTPCEQVTVRAALATLAHLHNSSAFCTISSMLRWSITRSFLPQICIELDTSQTPHICCINHAKLAPGWALIRANFGPIQEIGPKVGGVGTFLRVGVLLQDYGIASQ